MRRYVLSEDRAQVLREAMRGEALPTNRVLRSARAIRPGAPLCRVPPGASDRGTLSADAQLFAAMVEAAGGLSLRAWLATCLDTADVEAAAAGARARGSTEASGARRTTTTIALTDSAFARFVSARSAYGVTLAAIVRECVRGAACKQNA